MPDTAELLAAVGQRLELVREYSGGEGRTLCVRERGTGESLVVKVLSAGERPVELQELASLQHPRVPAVRRVGRLPDGRAFVVRAHVDGDAFAVLPRAPEALRPIVQQILEVLAYVHLRGIVHLDLKPANLVLDREGRVHLLDFGMAVRTGARARGGTPFYAAPEILLGSAPDHRADLFAVGAMIAEALAREPVALARFVDAFPAVDFLSAAGMRADELPPPFDRFVARCVARRPERRFPDAAAALEALCGGSGRPSAALLAPDPVGLFASELDAAGAAAHDVVLKGGDAADRRSIALHLAASLPGVARLVERDAELHIERDGGSATSIELPPLDAARLVGHLRSALGLDGAAAEAAARWLVAAGGPTSHGVAGVLQRLLESGELLPSGPRWVWPAAKSGRLRPPDAAPRPIAPSVDAIRRAAAAGLVEQAEAMWRQLAVDPAHEAAARAALAEGLLDGGEPARALPLCSGLPVLRAQALLDTGNFVAAARELAPLDPTGSPRSRRAAAELAMAGGRFERAFALLDHPGATLPERLTLAAALERAGRLDDCEALLRRCRSELAATAAPYPRASAHTVHGHVARGRGDLAMARRHFHAACELFRSLGHVRHAASEQLNLGVIAKDLGRHGEAVARFREARALYEHVGDAARAAIASADLGIAALAREDVATAIPLLAEAAATLVRLGDVGAGRLAAAMLARAHAEAGDAAAAHAALATVGEPDSDRLRQEVARVHERLRTAAAPRDDGGMPEPPYVGPSRELFRTFLAVNRQLAQATDLDQAMRRLLDAAVTLTAGRNGFLLVVREDGMQREFQSGDGGQEGQAFSRSLAHRAIQQQRTMTGGDVLADRELRDVPSIRNLQVRSAICAPFRSAGGTAGAIYVEHPGRAGVFTDADKEALEVLADQAAIAVDRMLREAATRHELTVSQQRLAVAERNAPKPRVRLLGDSAAMRELRAQIDRLAALELSVLVQGETGTGKELVARALHERGPRSRGPFVAENCSALPAELMERELFGHVEGAFTGADRDRPGLLELANGGTLFLDEVGDMPPALQAKLLRALQEQAIRRVGGTDTIQLDLRLVAATHKDLRAMVAAGEFREDLFYRLCAIELRVPPLRERGADAVQLAEHFVAGHAERRGRTLRLSPATRAVLGTYPWPGNVRELEHVIARAALLCDGDEIVDLQLPRVALPIGDGAVAAPEPVITLKEAERRAIAAAMQACAGDKAKAARALGISRTALYDKLKRHGLQS